MSSKPVTREQAGAKLHLLHNATDQTIERIDVTDEKAHDSTLFKTGSWLCGRLVLFDKAYFKYRRFALIDENDGYFVSRLKQNANPVITAELREWRGRAIPLEGKQIQDVVDDLAAVHRRGGRSGVQARSVRRNAITGHEAVPRRRRPQRGRRRLPSLYHESTARGVPAVRSQPTLYRCRWEVETLFRELKTQYELDRVRHEQPCCRGDSAVRGVAFTLVSRDLLDLVSDQADDDIVFPPERWAATFRSHAQLILHELGEYLGYSPPPLLERLIEDAQKIHQQRPILQETLATATQPRCES